LDNDSLEEEFFDDIELRGWSHWTTRGCKYTLKIFRECINDKSFVDIDQHDLKQYLKDLKNRKGRNGEMSSETIRKHINNLASFYEYLEDEDYVVKSPIPKFRRRYISNNYRTGRKGQKRQIIDLPKMRVFLGMILDLQDRAMYTLLAKTGLRAQELLSIDVEDVSLEEMTISIKATGKRKNMDVYFDLETRRQIETWLSIRGERANEGERALFVTDVGTRMSHVILNKRLKKYATEYGIHDPDTQDLEKRFTAHCFRHFFTTELLNSGMPRDYVKELRGDSRTETIDIYNHITPEELKRSYLEHIPRFNL
jgi:integrase/recombinase XerD